MPVRSLRCPLAWAMSWVSLLFFAFAIFIMIFDPDTLLALLASPLWFVALAGLLEAETRSAREQLRLDNQAPDTRSLAAGFKRGGQGVLSRCSVRLPGGGWRLYRTTVLPSLG